MVEGGGGAGRWGSSLWRRFSMAIVFVALYGAVWAVWANLPARPEGPTAQQRVEARLDKELPPGTPRPTVDRWLSARGVEHFVYKNLDDVWDLPETGLAPESIGAVIGAIMPVRTHRESKDKESVQVFFVFDKDDRLAERIVK